MIIIGRPIEGISLNGLEYLMNEDNTNYKYFETKESAVAFLRQNIDEPVTDMELEDRFIFEHIDYPQDCG